jgi:hypothetical protein
MARQVQAFECQPHIMEEFNVELSNEPGSLAANCEALAEAGVNILAIAAVGNSHARVAIVTNDSEATRAALDANGATYSVNELHTVSLAHEPGSLAAFTRSLAENAINLRSLYILAYSVDSCDIGYTTA